MARHHDRIGRLAAGLSLVAIAIVAVAILIPSRLPAARAPVYALLVAALASSAASYAFPWHRLQPTWRLAVGVGASAIVALLIALTGGRASVFYPFFFLVVAVSAAYYRPLPLALLTALVGLASFAYVLYSPATEDDLLRSGVEVASYAL